MRMFNPPPHSSRKPDQGWSDSRVGVWILPAEHRGWGLMGLLPGGLLLALAFLAAGCARKSEAPAPPPPNVTVAHPVEREVTEYAEFTGRVEELDGVDIQARASGYLMKEHFIAGSLVKQGDILFEIDPRPYQAVLDQSLARLQQTEAKVKQVQADFVRFEELLRRDAATQSEYDRALADRDMAVADVAAAKADVESARLDLEFCTIHAPMSGRISKSSISVGNLVTKDQTVLTNIVTIDPMYITFAVDELTTLRVEQAARQGKIKLHDEVQVPVYAGLANEEGFPHAGAINFADNQVKPGTGTLLVRGIFPNAEGILRPGLFARVRVPVGPPHNVLLVPDRAIVSDQSRKIILAVNDKNEVVARPVTTGPMHDGLRAIESGLQPNDRIIVEGQMWARPGTTVSPKLADAASAETPAPPKALGMRH